MSLTKEIESQKKKWFMSKIIILLLIMSSISGYYYYNIYKSSDIEEVSTVSYTAKKGDIRISIWGEGKVVWNDTVWLNFPINGTVKEILVSEWDEVKKWDIIAKLDDSLLQISLDKAKIWLKTANANLIAKKQTISSWELKIYSEQLDTTRTSYDVIKSQWEMDVANARLTMETSEFNLKTAKKDLESWDKLSVIDKTNYDIAVESAQKDLDNAKSNLVLIKKQEIEKYENTQENAIIKIGTAISYMDEYLLDVDLLLGITDLNKDKNNDIESYIWAKDSTTKALAKKTFDIAKADFENFKIEWQSYMKNQDFSKILSFIDKIENVSQLTNHTLQYTLTTIKASIVSTVLTEQEINNYISDFEKNINEMKSQIHNIKQARQDIEESKTSMDTKIATQKNLVSSLESKLKLAISNVDKSENTSIITKENLEEKVILAEKQYESATQQYNNAVTKLENNLKLAEKQIDISSASLGVKEEGPTNSELAPYYIAIENANKQVEEAEKKLEDAILRSPVDGIVLELTANIWETVWWTNDFISIGTSQDKYIESYLEEWDIVKIFDTQKVYITLDAIDGVEFTWEVSYVSNKWEEDTNGIISYKVLIDYNSEDTRIKDGMWVTLDFITKEANKVLLIPVQSVLPYNGKPSVQMEDGTWKEVITWFTDNKLVEIISWLETGDIVIYKE